MHLHAQRNFRSDFDALLVTTAGGHTASRPSSLILIGSLLAGSKAGLLDRQPACWIDSLLVGSTTGLLDRQPVYWIDSLLICADSPRGYGLDKDRRWRRPQKPSGIKPCCQEAVGSRHRAVGIEKRASSWIRRLPRAKARQL
jgi:hypothetical protein